MSWTSKADLSTDLIIRSIEGADEIRAVEDLQKEVWKLPDLDIVPFTQLVAAIAAGGVLIGAFDGANLIGFVYGFVGNENGRVTHHSHMLAVKSAYRNFSVGLRLKQAQRDHVLAQGITEMTWTFDPLQSLNAHFNFARLGVISDRYLIDFYGSDAASFLHRNGTDRLWVTWLLANRRVVERLESSFDDVNAEPLVTLVESNENKEPLLRDLDLKDPSGQLSIEIPTEIRSIEQQDPGMAAAWRSATQSAFSAAFTAGYAAVEFVRGARAGRYILGRKKSNDIA